MLGIDLSPGLPSVKPSVAEIRAMRGSNRRGFLATSAAAAAVPLLPDLGFLAPVSRAAAADTRIDPNQVRHSPSIGLLIELIQTTPRDKCVAVFIEQLQAGLSYQDLLSALLLATIEHGDPHQVLGVYSAHRVSSEARIEERLLPLFWALDRIVTGFQDGGAQAHGGLTGELPRAGQASAIFREAMAKLDPSLAERAIVVLGRAQGHRRAMSLLWECGARRVCGSLGHHPIMVANTWRTLEALGWQHAEQVLRYLARTLPRHEADRTYEPNQERARRTLPGLPRPIGQPTSRIEVPSLEVFNLLRQGETDAVCDLICTRLSSGRVKAGAVWDAVHLVAADLLFRYKKGGVAIGSYLIHAVTSTNALRCGFDCSDDDRVRLLILLQSIGGLGNQFVLPNEKDGQLRGMNLLDRKADDTRDSASIGDVFAMLPNKTKDPSPEEAEAYRKVSDEACRMSFALLQKLANQVAFKQAARSLLCVKATRDAHDLKYPVAAFEDTGLANPEWRPYLLASSVHALHGTASSDSTALIQAKGSRPVKSTASAHRMKAHRICAPNPRRKRERPSVS